MDPVILSIRRPCTARTRLTMPRVPFPSPCFLGKVFKSGVRKVFAEGKGTRGKHPGATKKGTK